MRYEKGHKEATRQRILETAADEFRTHGIAAAGLAGIMQRADLTVGAFYPHFASKAELVSETLAHVLDVKRAKMQKLIAAGGLDAAIEAYLSAQNLADLRQGCPSAALLPEVARQGDDARSAYKDGLMPFIAMLAGQLPEKNPETAKRRAFALFGLLVGTLQIARAIPDATLAKSVLTEGIATAKSLAAAPPTKSSRKTATKVRR